MPEPQVPATPEPRAIRFVGLAILLATVAYPIVATVLVMTRAFPVTPEGRMTGLQDVYGFYFLGVGLTLYALSFLIPRWMSPSNSIPGGSAAARFRATVAGMALSEAAGIVGLLYTLLTGRLGLAWVLWGLAISGCILHFPSRYSPPDSAPDSEE